MSKLGFLGSIAALVLATVTVARTAEGADLRVTVGCPTWTPETAAQVEARVRASLLVEGKSVTNVAITCEAETTVAVATNRGELVRPVTRRGHSLEDDVVEAVEKTLRELQGLAQPQSSPVSTANATGAPAQPVDASPSPPADAGRATPAPSPVPARADERRHQVEIQLRGIGERWSGSWALGAEAGMSVGDERLQYGLIVAGRTATGEPSSFDLDEWSAAARVQLTLREAAGMRAGLSLGGNLLITRPAAPLVAESASMLATAFVELSVSRPFWLGSLGLSPSVGGRLFSASRHVRVDGQEAMTLPIVTPQLSLVAIWALPL